MKIEVITEAINRFKSATIILKGTLTFIYCEAIRNQLEMNLTKNDHLCIIIPQLKELDLSVLQLFYSLYHTAVSKNKRVSFRASVPADLRTMIENAGLNIIGKKTL